MRVINGFEELEEVLKRKDHKLSTNVEVALYDLLHSCGLKESDIIAEGKYDKQVGDAKEKIYKEFSEMFGFKYKWDGFYEIEQ